MEGIAEGAGFVSDDQPGVGGDQRRDPAAIGHDHRGAGDHCLGGHIPKALVFRGEDEDIGIEVGGPLLLAVERSREADAAVEAEAGSKRLEGGAMTPLPLGTGENEGGPSVWRRPHVGGKRLDEKIEALDPGQAADEEDDTLAVAKAKAAAK